MHFSSRKPGARQNNEDHKQYFLKSQAGVLLNTVLYPAWGDAEVLPVKELVHGRTIRYRNWTESS